MIFLFPDDKRGVPRVTNSFLDLAELLESIPESFIVGVPGKAAGYRNVSGMIFKEKQFQNDRKPKLRICRSQVPGRGRCQRETYWTKSLDMVEERRRGEVMKE